MGTGKDYGLPEEYHDWVEVGYATGRPYIEVTITKVTGHLGSAVNHLRTIRLVPPRPKLPDAKPGAVISFKSRITGNRLRAVWTGTPLRPWNVYDFTGGYAALSPSDLLATVDDDGFTVELEGL